MKLIDSQIDQETNNCYDFEDLKNMYQKKLQENNHFREIEIMRVLMNLTNCKIIEEEYR